MQNLVFEVYIIRKTRYFVIIFLLMLSLAGKAQAAEPTMQAGMVTTAHSGLNVRATPSSGGSLLGQLPKGSFITLLTRQGDWWQVEYADGRYGYCHANYIQVLGGTSKTVSTASGNLNVRSGPGTGYSKTGSLPKGKTVIVLSENGSWSRVLYAGTKTGYVSSSYLSGGYSAISLAVPSFKQTDSRWADHYIASSGKTIRQIGCATTAVAMLESYRTGTTIFPDTMSRQLRYTASGSLYWPENYRVVTGSENLLSQIYSQLQMGKPVLFGARNSAGKQHWVIINGFTGGSLNAANFTILDPGSNSRKNLQELLSLYPIFYKFFTYP